MTLLGTSSVVDALARPIQRADSARNRGLDRVWERSRSVAPLRGASALLAWEHIPSR